jgi:cysteinyl-tRNA synthetase
MSSKYLGDTFDIHGGGMDLQATHHTNEIAQSQACNHTAPVKYWMHTNMLTVNGVRMSKTAGNGFLPGELFTGNHPLLEKGYSPMAVRFFMMQTHYRSTLDFSNEALQASEKGYARLMTSIKTLDNLKASSTSTTSIKDIEKNCYDAMNDDFNTPILIANLFEGARIINSINDGKETITNDDITALKTLMHNFVFDVLGLKSDTSNIANDKALQGVMEIILDIRKEIKAKKDFAASDKLRDDLSKINISIKDTKDGAVWSIGE